MTVDFSPGPAPWWLSPFRPWQFFLRLQVAPTVAIFETACGFILAVLAMSLVFAAHWLPGLLQILHLRPAVLSNILPQLLMLEAALLEEVIYRGLLLTALLHWWHRPAWAIFFSSLLFGIAHAANPHATALSVLSNSLGGVMYALPYVLTGRLYYSVALHFGWNWTQGILFGFPMSGVMFSSVMTVSVAGPAWMTGAAYGPEGGVIGIGARLFIMAITLMILRRWLK